MRIALAQTEIFSKQYEKNKKTALSICNLAQAMEVRLLLFPEMSFTGFNMDTDYSIAAGLYTVPWMQKLATTGQCYLGFGWVKALPTCEIDGIRFGCLICYDLRFPEVFSAFAPKTDCILVPANWPERRKLHWCSLLTARAIENQVYVAGINCVGTQDGLHYSGDSRFIAPDGTILQDCRSASGCFVCDLSAKTVAETRQVFPVQKDRRPDFYRSILL